MSSYFHLPNTRATNLYGTCIYIHVSRKYNSRQVIALFVKCFSHRICYHEYFLVSLLKQEYYKDTQRLFSHHDPEVYSEHGLLVNISSWIVITNKHPSPATTHQSFHPTYALSDPTSNSKYHLCVMATETKIGIILTSTVDRVLFFNGPSFHQFRNVKPTLWPMRKKCEILTYKCFFISVPQNPLRCARLSNILCTGCQ